MKSVQSANPMSKQGQFGQHLDANQGGLESLLGQNKLVPKPREAKGKSSQRFSQFIDDSSTINEINQLQERKRQLQQQLMGIRSDMSQHKGCITACALSPTEDYYEHQRTAADNCSSFNIEPPNGAYEYCLAQNQHMLPQIADSRQSGSKQLNLKKINGNSGQPKLLSSQNIPSKSPGTFSDIVHGGHGS